MPSLSARQMLAKLRYDSLTEGAGRYTIHYQDRRAGLVAMRFDELLRVEGSFMVAQGVEDEVYIPMHRIRKIADGNGTLVWERRVGR